PIPLLTRQLANSAANLPIPLLTRKLAISAKRMLTSQINIGNLPLSLPSTVLSQSILRLVTLKNNL
ncbi:MAG: hypothetical protein WB424_03610, partial [Terracidiphilus sp.]